MPRYLSFPPRLLERRTMRVPVVVQLLGASGLAAAAPWLLVLAAAFRPTFTADTRLHKRPLQTVRDQPGTPKAASASHPTGLTPTVTGPRRRSAAHGS